LGLKLKKQIVEALKWALSKFEDKTPQVNAWPFPVEVEIKSLSEPPVKIKPTVKKATTRKPAAKKTTKKAK
jgi:hypothetical protein